MALQQVAVVSAYGRDKYGVTYDARNWERVEDAKGRYGDAQLRHIVQESSDGLFDRESRLLHAAHAAWNALARLEMIARQVGL
jgi:hypothetical protein